jgi:uncharacterized RDD family membrane protein YckC
MVYEGMDDHHIIDTPENIEFSYAIAGIGSRFLATVIDTVFLALVQLLLLLVVGLAIGLLEAMEVGLQHLDSIFLAVWSLLSFLFLWGYYIFFELFWNGQTPGKRAIKIRVVQRGGRPVGFAAAVIRNLVRVIDFLPGFYGIGVLIMFIDRQARRAGDLAAGTLVVKDRLSVSLDSLARQAERSARPVRPPSSIGPEQPAAIRASSSSFTPTIPNLDRLTTADYNLVQNFLRRRSELGKESREQLGQQLAENIGARVGLTLKKSDHQKFLEYVAYEYRLMREQEEPAY